MSSSTNRRRHTRHPRTALAWLQFRGELTFRPTVTLDLSEEGAQFSSLRAAVPGEPIILSIQARENEAPQECKGVVMWSELEYNGLHRFGVRIVDLWDDERLRLRAALAEGHAEVCAVA